jgi:sterol 3beta-glucosyltransferase
MASEDKLREQVGRKLTKRQKPQRRVSLDVPDRFKNVGDAHEDYTAPQSFGNLNMNQSMFSLVTRVGSQADLRARVEENASSGSESEEQHHKPTTTKLSKHKRKISESRLLRSIPRLHVRSNKEKISEDENGQDQMSSSQILPPKPHMAPELPASPKLPSVTSSGRKEEDKSEQVDGGSERLSRQGRRSRHGSVVSSKHLPLVSLEQRLKEIFEFDHVESVIAGRYPSFCSMMLG